MKKSPFYESQHDRSDKVEFFKSSNALIPLHFHRSIELLYITAGAVETTVGEEEFVCETDHIVFVHKCGAHALVPAPSYQNYVLIIGPRYSDDFKSIFQTETLPAHLCDTKFNRTLLPFFTALDRQKNASELIKKGYIDIIIGNLLSHYRCVPAVGTPNIGTVINVLNYIDDHFTEQLTLDDLADVFGYNKYYFSRLFNMYIGESLNSYINSVRVRNIVAEARKQESPNLSELVFENGFDSMTTFYRNFAKQYDLSPTEVFKTK